MTARQYHLKYGAGEIPLRLPEKLAADIFLLSPPPSMKPADPVREIETALDNPVDSDRLESILNPDDRVLITVPDITRKAAAHLYMPSILARIESARIPPENVRILFATGIHRHVTREEQIKILGENTATKYQTVSHDARDDSGLAEIGRMPSGEPLKVNSLVRWATKTILTGSVQYHYLAGFSGGRKSILPGISSYSNCLEMHRLSLDPAGPGRHPLVRPGLLHGNPMHDAMTAAASIISPAFIVNTVLDETDSLVAVLAGHWQKAFLHACEISARIQSATIPRRFDVVIVSCGGDPFDINMVQSHKSLDNAFQAVRQDGLGVMVFLAACPDGAGNKTFYNWFDYPTETAHESALRERFEINGQTALALRHKTARSRTVLVSSIPPEISGKMGMIHATSADTAMRIVERLDGLPGSPSVCIIPNGHFAYPVLPVEHHD